MKDDLRARTEDKLSPESVTQSLIQAGALLTGYELVKSSILDGVRDFFIIGFDEAGMTISPEYQKVLALEPKNKFRASVAWLIEMEALKPEHAETLERIRDHRGEVAHELARLLIDPDAGVDVSLLKDLRDCMHALDRFWGSIEVDINPDFDGTEVDLDAIRSGSGLLLDYLCDLSGLDGESSESKPRGDS
ncbi:hypothetical protein [Rhodococcus sp. LW-XY12]|uniref:hypothetical protein n=1 Tax=Rhodococcus sp. LW-XY12 TaxID=2856851 RepID=UPI001C572ED6|nr:hypothetical protein [Rhodococcus sp. LW-XY12]QXU52162.1 hypothetical protein KXC42_14775 [Rhodococcus sp. LW-XY12]